MPTVVTNESNGRRIRAVVDAAAVSQPIFVERVCVITASPGAGGNMLVEATWSVPSAVAAGTATWFPWDAGTVGAKTVQLLSLGTAVRFTAGAAAGTGEVAQ